MTTSKTNPNGFKIGDIVQLKSKGCDMTVQDISYHTEITHNNRKLKLVSCVWMTSDWQICTGRFDERTLMYPKKYVNRENL